MSSPGDNDYDFAPITPAQPPVAQQHPIAPPPSSPQAAQPDIGGDFVPVQQPSFLEDMMHPMGEHIPLFDGFIKGAKDAWGDQPVVPEEAQKWLQKNWFNDYQNGHTSMVRGFNEAVLQPFIYSGYLAQRAFSAGLGGVQQGLYEQATAAGAPEDLARVVPSLLEYETSRGDVLAEHAPAAPAVRAAERIPTIDEATRVGAVGPGGETAYFHTNETPLADHDVAEAMAKRAELGPEPEATQAGEPPPADIHSVARQLAPDTFAEYDPLAQRRDTYRSWLGELRDAKAQEPEATQLQGRIDDILGKVNGVEDRLTKTAAQRLDDARDQLDDFMRSDTPQMAQVRQQLLETDYRMRDLAPDVAAAYRKAQEQFPEHEEPLNEQAPQGPEQTPVVQALLAEAQERATKQAVEETPRVSTDENPITDIAGDVQRKLVAAGRPAEEAQASAAIVQAHYEARAERFGGAKVTAQDLYASEAPAIKAAGRVAKEPEFAQRTLEQSKRGSIALKDGRATIKLFKSADASTFMHETGHAWLEEMMRDAADERAPADLKADAKTVHDWLGTKTGEEIPTKAHEKFARGFERYLMEGVAPSQKLASVFAKFKAWLTQIYETVNRLRSPINDDIRAVFDRLISTPADRAVIAEERPIAETMADLHEADAENTAPENAANVADDIRSEIDRVARERVPEVHAELTSEATTGGIPAPDPSAPSSSVPSGPAAGDDGSPKATGAKPAGGDEAAPESGDARRGPSPAGLDKAGNIRLENITTTDDAKSVIRQLAANSMDFNNARYGEASYTLYHQIRASGQLLADTAQAASDAQKKWEISGSDTDAVAYAQATQRALIAAEARAELTAGWGRAGHAFRKVSNLKQAETVVDYLKRTTGKTLDDLKDEGRLLNQLDTPDQKAKFLQDSRSTSYQKFRSGLISYFINNLISGPITHAGYSIGNTVWALTKAVPTTFVSATIDSLRGRTGADRVYYGEIPAQIYAITRGARESLPAAVRAAVTGVPYMKGAEALDKLEAAKTGEEGPEANPAPLNEPGLRQQQIFPNSGPVLKTAGYVLETPGRVVSAIHTIFYSVCYEQEISRLAYRDAMAKDLDGHGFATRVAEFTQNPPEEAISAAHDEALKMVLMQRPAYDSSMGKLAQAVNNNLAFKIIMPFMQIGSNILREGLVEHTPLGPLVSQSVRDNLKGVNGEAARSTQYAKIMVGTSAAVAVLGLTAEGILTGGGPDDPRQRQSLEATGWKPYSIRMGDYYVPYRKYLGPLGPLVAGASDTYEIGHTWKEDGLQKAAAASVFGFAEVVGDETWMSGLSKFIDAARHYSTGGERYLRGLAVDFIPFSVAMRQMTQLTDPYVRQQNNLIDAAKAVTPGLSQDLLPRRNVWGEPILSHTSLGPSEAVDDPVDIELQRLNKYYPAPFRHDINGVKLTDQQYDDFVRIGGRYAKMQLLHDMQSPYWPTMDDESKIEMIKSDISTARDQARTAIMAADPTIWQRATAIKLGQLQRNRQ